MIRVENHAVQTAQEADRFARRLHTLLEHRWFAYRKARKRCRQKVDEKPVHDLRVEIRRALATLELLSPLLPTMEAARAAKALRIELKMLSRLRDAHVHLEAVGQQLPTFGAARPLYNTLQKRERRLERSISKELRQSGVGKPARRFRRLVKALKRRSAAAGAESAVLAAVQKAFDHVARCQANIDLKHIETIHRTRVAFKKFRYMVEAVQSVRPLASARQLNALQRYQSRMGGIQDAETLLARAEKFRRKKGAQDMAGYCAHLKRRRDELVHRFVASPWDLRTLWPWPTQPRKKRECNFIS